MREIAFWIHLVLGSVLIVLGVNWDSVPISLAGIYGLLIWFGIDRLEQGKKRG